MKGFNVLGIDPGFASIGYAVTKVAENGLVPLELGVIRTEKSTAKRNVRASEDNLERAKEIAKELKGLVESYNIDLICAETLSYPRNSAAAAKMAMCWGVIAAWAVQHSIPVVQATPQEIKKAVAGKKDASKTEVQAGVDQEYPSIKTIKGANGKPYLLQDIPPSLWEHPYDALAAVIACKESEVFLLVRRMASCAVLTE